MPRKSAADSCETSKAVQLLTGHHGERRPGGGAMQRAIQFQIREVARGELPSRRRCAGLSTLPVTPIIVRHRRERREQDTSRGHSILNASYWVPR